MLHKAFSLLFVIVLSGCSVFGVRLEEEPPYSSLLLEPPFELRRYKNYIVAETESTGNYDEAVDTCFQRLFQYISGENIEEMKVTMTAPVEIRDASQSLQRTAPVLIEGGFKGRAWKMSFVLPDGFTLQTAPIPTNKLVRLREERGKTVAAMTFSGTLSEEKSQFKLSELRAWISQKNLRIVSNPTLAGYDPPWTIPFLRRNEVMISVKE